MNTLVNPHNHYTIRCPRCAWTYGPITGLKARDAIEDGHWSCLECRFEFPLPQNLKEHRE